MKQTRIQLFRKIIFVPPLAFLLALTTAFIFLAHGKGEAVRFWQLNA
jgi:hypothetical protein